jgi:hypothetical protein
MPAKGRGESENEVIRLTLSRKKKAEENVLLIYRKKRREEKAKGKLENPPIGFSALLV